MFVITMCFKIEQYKNISDVLKKFHGNFMQIMHN